MPAMTPSRRQVLLSITGLAVAGPLIQVRGAPLAVAADAFDDLRARWRTVLLGSGYDPAQEPYTSALAALGDEAAGYHSSMSSSGTSLWPDLPLGTISRNMSSSFGRLALMSRAYVSPGTGLTGNNSLVAAVIDGLDRLVANHFRDDGQTYDNWFHWQISSPRSLLDTSVLIYDQLDSGRLTTYLASVDAHTPLSIIAGSDNGGANQVNTCRVIALSGVLGKSSGKVAAARDGLSSVFGEVRNGNGFYPDGGFIQHTWTPYAASYGVDLLGGLTRMFALLSGSQWEITDPQRQDVLDAVTNGFAPALHNGLIMDMFAGRMVSYSGTGLSPTHIIGVDHHHGHGVILEMIRLADSGLASPAERAAWRSMAKGMLQRDYFLPVMERPTLGASTLATFASVLNDSSLTPAPPPTDHHVFGSLDRAVHRRPGWAAGVSMSSERIAHFEHGNGENQRSWHTGSGMLSWWGENSLGHFSDNYWCTVNPYRHPGTTVSTKTLADGAGGSWGDPRPDIKFAGGATDGKYGAVGQDVRGIQSTLTGRKSWFCLDDSIVCLGAGITCTDGVAVETIVENRNLGESGNQTLSADGVAQPSTLGWSKTFTGVQSMALSGFGGYVFPGGATIKALREARQGKWRDIHPNGPTKVFTRRYLTLWRDHGVNPNASRYHYELMPGATASQAATRAASPATVLANTANVQAISDAATGVTAATFFAAGSAGPITVDRRCSVLMRESRGRLTIAVADPSRSARTVRVAIDRSGFNTASAPATVNVIDTNPIELLVETGGSLGDSHVITFGTGSPVEPSWDASLAANRDAFVRNGQYRDTNYGSSGFLNVRNSSSNGYARRAFVGFNLSGLQKAPSRAIMWVRGSTTDSAGTHTEITAYSASNSWTQSGVTWANQPALWSEQDTRPVSDRVDWLPFDVTSAVQAQFSAGTVTFSFAQSDLLVALDSRERSEPSIRPYLEVIG